MELIFTSLLRFNKLQHRISVWLSKLKQWFVLADARSYRTNSALFVKSWKSPQWPSQTKLCVLHNQLWCYQSLLTRRLVGMSLPSPAHVPLLVATGDSCAIRRDILLHHAPSGLKCSSTCNNKQDGLLIPQLDVWEKWLTKMGWCL